MDSEDSSIIVHIHIGINPKEARVEVISDPEAVVSEDSGGGRGVIVGGPDAIGTPPAPPGAPPFRTS